MNATAVSRFISAHYRVLRLGFLWSSDAFIIFLSSVVAIFLYTRAMPLPYTWPDIFGVTGVLFAVHVVAFSVFRIYNVSFQYASMLLTLKIASIQAAYLLGSYFILDFLFGDLWPPLIAVLSGFMIIGGSVFLRLSGLIYIEVIEMRRESHKHVLVYGAGETGKQIALALRNQRSTSGDPVRLLGFLDDDPTMKGKIVYGYKVLGGLEELERILVNHDVNEVVAAIPSLDGDRLRDLRSRCDQLNISVKSIPSFYEIYNRAPEEMLSSLREVQFEDLLRRPRRSFPVDALVERFAGKTSLVLGGGGSIGSELVNQLLRLGCEKVVVADASELNLYQLAGRFREHASRLEISLIDAKNRVALSTCFAAHRPQVVFHAAAYKHVDLVETNPVAGVLNNVGSMKNAADLADEFACEQFIFISTDKAVRPASVMGTTKRIGELYVRALDAKSSCNLFSVRFGNVIGSSGSLVPNVVSRIQRGLPIQVTHPDMTRYFMLLPEAASLILTSCLHARGGEIFILNMGEPVKIVDLVRDLMMMLDKRPDVDLPIEFIGPRPGEKIEEELFADDVEQVREMDGFFVSTAAQLDLDKVGPAVDAILEAGARGRQEDLMTLIRDAIALPAKDHTRV